MRITRFYRSKSDIENLSRLRTVIPTDVDRFDYRGVVVNKPWGYEYLMYENAHVAVWILYVARDHKTSMHCHPNKKTSLVVISGEVVCHTLEGWLGRKTGDGIIIDEGVFHSTRAASDEGAFIMEIESPPNKRDLVRLKDEYGREQKGYEGAAQMSRELDKYEYIDFHNLTMSKPHTKMLRDTAFSLVHQDRATDVASWIRRERASLLCLLQGKLHAADGRLVLATGEAAEFAALRRSNIITFSDILFLTLSYGRYR